ncbi:MAG: ACP S-malonyltransferase [Candidatus Rifleibacteriota bacterium]
MKAIIFPGQGSQKVGMAQAMVNRFSWAAEMAAHTDEILGRPLTRICFEGPEEELKKTSNTQPAIFFASAVLTEWLKRNGVPFHAAAGHSLGEYNAVYAAGVADYEDLLRLVSLRAAAMERACPAGTGAMSAVMMLDREKLDEICRQASTEGTCVVANYNCPGQLVISGAVAAVKKAGELASAAGAKRVMPLEVSGPFHSPLMQNARDELAQAIANINFRQARMPIYGNIDAAPATDPDVIKTKLLDQLTGSVLWEDTVKRMVKDGYNDFTEVGPGKVLAGLNKKIDSAAATQFACDPESLEQLLSAAVAG